MKRKTKAQTPKQWFFIDGFDGNLKYFDTLASARKAARQCHCLGVWLHHPNGNVEWVVSDYGPLP